MSGGSSAAAGGDRSGERDPEAQEQQAEERQHRSDVADEREVEERALLGHRVERGGGERHRHPPLVERLVVVDPRLVARVAGVARAQLGRERALRTPCRRRCPRRAARARAPGSRARPASTRRGPGTPARRRGRTARPVRPRGSRSLPRVTHVACPPPSAGLRPRPRRARRAAAARGASRSCAPTRRRARSSPRSRAAPAAFVVSGMRWRTSW